jgi:4-hydroxyphenylpyruvate dioxygenase-like putative hemolysin
MELLLLFALGLLAVFSACEIALKVWDASRARARRRMSAAEKAYQAQLDARMRKVAADVQAVYDALTRHSRS